MPPSPGPAPDLVLHVRHGCPPCEELRAALPDLLARRAADGAPVPALRVAPIDDDPALIARYGAVVPVLVLGDAELTLVTSLRQAGAFLARTLGDAR